MILLQSNLSFPNTMQHRLGFLMQMGALIFLPMVMFWQLQFGLQVIYMPILLIVGIVVFSIGTKLRDSK